MDQQYTHIAIRQVKDTAFFQYTVSTWLEYGIPNKNIFLLFYKCHSVVLNLRLNWTVFYIKTRGFCNNVDRYTITHSAYVGYTGLR